MPSPWVGLCPPSSLLSFTDSELCLFSSSQPPGAPEQTLVVTRAHYGLKRTHSFPHLSCPMPTVPVLSQVSRMCSFRLPKDASGTLCLLCCLLSLVQSSLTMAPRSASERLGWPRAQNHPPVLTAPNPLKSIKIWSSWLTQWTLQSKK